MQQKSIFGFSISVMNSWLGAEPNSVIGCPRFVAFAKGIFAIYLLILENKCSRDLLVNVPACKCPRLYIFTIMVSILPWASSVSSRMYPTMGWISANLQKKCKYQICKKDNCIKTSIIKGLFSQSRLHTIKKVPISNYPFCIHHKSGTP